ncbi:MAG: PaaI family thioesterase [Sporomusaceae bacterium]|nr:PaaI family thioesterase [Sporomusaceae bacterium]
MQPGSHDQSAAAASSDSPELNRWKGYLIKTYADNPFVNLMQMDIADIGPGKAVITMPVAREIHTNLYGVAHGGALAALADTAMGIACATLKRRVVTLELNLNYIKAAAVQAALQATATVIHNGSRTIVAECDIADGSQALLIKARATFFVIGQFEGV